MFDRTETLRDSQELDAAADAARPGVVVVYSEAPVAGDGVYAARRELSIGRAPDGGIYLADSAMSRAHASLRLHANTVEIADLNSRNGTFVNGRQIAGPTALSAGDVVRCGSTLLLYVDDVSRFKGWRQPVKGSLLIGGPAVAALRRELGAFARSSLEVLLLGESGTGKELAAREIHSQSRRRGVFVAVNSAAIPEQLFESEIFGVARGAFTGADRDRPGAFQRAHGGTLFLDEIAELPLAQQAKLLRAVEQRQVLPVGAGTPVATEVRLVTATHRDLARETEQQRFRFDLYQRLRGAVVQLPPLRERREDVALLAEHFLCLEAKAATSPTIVAARSSANVTEALLCYDWPGNVRELQRSLQEALLRANAEGSARLQLRHLRSELQPGTGQSPDDPLQTIKDALALHQGNVSRAATTLGMHRARIYTLLRESGIRAEDFR